MSVSLTRYPQLYLNLWPADFNEDGRTDLVAATQGGTFGSDPVPADLVVSIGRGDGTFRTPVPLGFAAVPLNVADFNSDGFIDILILRATSLEVVPGNGNGTFEPPRAIDTGQFMLGLRGWAIVADFNADGHRDVIVPEYVSASFETGLTVYPGNGDFSFGPAVRLLTPSQFARDGISGDFNGDGRRDFAVANECCEISVFLNQGSLVFARSDIASQNENTDITTGDLNADGRLDLISTSWMLDHPLADGELVIRLGNGDGTFGEPVVHDTGVQGETSVVVGDFNRDGRLDVATGNRSRNNRDEITHQLWDSVSIMPGDGTGRLLPATSFSLGTVNPVYGAPDPLYPGGHHQLNTSDVNGDGRTDLIASPAVVLINRAPTPNRPPVVFAGPDEAKFVEGPYTLPGEASDPDMHWLTYTWTDESGMVVGSAPWAYVRPERGTTTYTLTVDDGHGGIASDSVTIRTHSQDFAIGIDAPTGFESVVAETPYVIRWSTSEDPDPAIDSFSLFYTVDEGRTFTPVPGCEEFGPDARSCTWASPAPVSDRLRLRLVARRADGDWLVLSERFRVVRAADVLPPPWSSADVGAVGAAGHTSYSDGTWTVDGSGADIWGSADEFHYAYRPAPGNFTLTVRVANIENVHRWVKAGIMIREDLSPGSRHASLFATPRTERGLAFQRRLHLNGQSEHTSGPAVAPAVWLKVVRFENLVSTYYRASDSDEWTLVARETFAALREPLYVGLAVSSHVDGALATATFDNVAYEQLLPTEMRSLDIGSVGVAGSATFDGAIHEVQASGADIWGTRDAFRFAYNRFSFSSSPLFVSARVRSIENTHRWAKAGVMFRESFEPDARHVMVIVSPGRGVAMQYRSVRGGETAQAALMEGTAPQWVRLERSGLNTYTGYASGDGMTWQMLASVDIDMSAGSGLVVTSHNNATLATATFESVSFGQR